MADHAPVMIWLSGNDKRFTWFNKPWLEFTGRTMDQELGDGWASRVHPEDRATCMETFSRSFDELQPFTMEYRLRRKDGQWRWVLDNATPLHKDDGSFAGYIGSCIDISVRKRAEQELEQYRNELKKLASELMLAEERERRRLAQDLHDGLGQALFRARTKIAELSPAPAAKEAEAILEEVAKMMNTMTFELSPPVLRTLGLRPALKSLALDMRQRYGLCVDIDDDGKDFVVSERAAMVLFRCTRELLINTAKHAKTDRAKLSVRTPKREIRITVEDRGKGFDFQQATSVESGRFGLFSVRERLSTIGGVLKVRSSPGTGTATTITAPLGASVRRARQGAERG